MNATESQGAVVQALPFCLNRQAAIAFSSFKPAFFDEHVRPRLSELRAGTSVLYLREELEGVIRSMFRVSEGADAPGEQHVESGNSGQITSAGKRKWEKRQPASTSAATERGPSTNTSKAYDFTRALNALKTPKPG